MSDPAKVPFGAGKKEPEQPLPPVMREHCGRKFPSHYPYCPNCGAPLKALMSD